MQKHKRKIAIIISIFMLLTVILGMLAPLVANASSELDKAKAELAELEEQKEKIKDELKSIEADQNLAYKEQQTLETQIQNTMKQIETTETIIDELATNIEIETQNLLDAEAKMNDQYDTFKTRVRVMYENGDPSYLDVLLASSDFVSMLSNLEIAKQIMDYDKKVFEDYTENARIVEEAKLELEENKLSQEVHKQSLSSKKAELDQDLAQSQALMAKLKANEKDQTLALEEAEAAEEEMSKHIAQLALQSAGVYVGGDFIWPTPGYTIITSPFGMRTHPVTGKPSTMHKGIDIGAAGGTNILAANGGKVIVSTYSSSYGNYVMVDHGGGMVTTYAHMSKRLCSVGDIVGQGEVIGLVGSTGWSTGNHLHFEIIKDGSHQNPMNYFTAG